MRVYACGGRGVGEGGGDSRGLKTTVKNRYWDKFLYFAWNYFRADFILRLRFTFRNRMFTQRQIFEKLINGVGHYNSLHPISGVISTFNI